MSPLATQFGDVGAPARLAQIWFAELLHDGFALTVSGVAEPFAKLGAELSLLNRAGVRHLFERLLEDAGIWKPAAGTNAFALAECGVNAEVAMLVAVHPWDIDGAARADSARPGSTAPVAGIRRTSRRQTLPWLRWRNWPGR